MEGEEKKQKATMAKTNITVLQMKRSKQVKVSSFFTSTRKRRKTISDDIPSDSEHRLGPIPLSLLHDDSRVTVSRKSNGIVVDPLAEGLGSALNVKPQYLRASHSENNDCLSSWIIHCPKWFPSSSCVGKSPTDVTDFYTEWKLHPETRKELRIFGKPYRENRWSQAWGHSINYSGLENNAGRPIEESPTLPVLMKKVNQLMDHASANLAISSYYHEFNACLQNWYTPDDSIGLHSDDEGYLYANHPIFSISWGGTRRFLLRPKRDKKNNNCMTGIETTEVWLEDGDLLIMGGACQKTHKHEVPRQRRKDAPTSNRISWTVRSIDKSKLK